MSNVRQRTLGVSDGSGPASTEQCPLLDGVRVVEISDELGEYCGRLLAGLGADVIKVEPPGGNETRRYGPFLENEENEEIRQGEDAEPRTERSLYFWHYNFGKRGITLDLDAAEGRAAFL